MKKRNFNFLALLTVLMFATTVGAIAQQVFKTTPSSVIGFLEYVPQDYNSNSNKYPIVIFLHGLGERGPQGTDPNVLINGVGALTRNGPPEHIKNGAQFPFIVVSPQLKNNYGDWNNGYILEVIDYVKTYLRVDEKRIYLTGLSLGGGGTWGLAQDYPKLFAAIAPVCGHRNTPSRACDLVQEKVPVWAFHGQKDSTVPLARSVDMVNALNACQPAPSPLAILTIYPGVNHNSWDNAYRTDHAVHDPNVYEWMTSYTNTQNGGNKIPTANAGSDVTISGSSSSLSGSGSDLDGGSISSYNWVQTSGPSQAILSNGNSANASISNLGEGVYTFRLRVTDNGGESDSDYKKITVNTGTGNVAPVASAGTDKNVSLPTTTATLSGSGTDSDGSVASYAWTKISGGTAVMSGASTSTLITSSLESGSYGFRLTITDNDGATNSDDVNVYVNSSSNIAPVAYAGKGVVVVLPINYKILAGSGTDADGTIASYEWTKVSGPACTLSDVTTTRLMVSDVTSGSYTFQLKVTDNQGASAVDELTVKFNYTPIANAGSNVTLTLPTNSTTLNGSATDQQGTISSYAWLKLSGPNATLNNATTQNLSLSDLAAGVYSFQLTVKDNQGTKGVDVTTVTVLGTSGSQARAASPSSTEVAEATLQAEPTPQKFDLTDWNSLSEANCSVIIFNDGGRQIFSGIWMEDSYRSLFTTKGLYFYNIFQNGMRIDAGKIFVER